ncbi:MAG: hypothetical protein JRM80_09675 [Nitrososphaerota archaeon]|nr:hypothetical protein [Nitrososphaerota archaeon]
MVGAVIVVVLIVGVGAYYLMSGTGTKATTTSTTTTTTSTSSTSALGYAVQIGNSATVGHYLENGTGFTLYMFGADKPGNGTSACAGSCAAAWPPFYASSLSVPSGLNPSNFSTITRANGAKQTTYNGWPLYYYVADSSSGNMYGEGLSQFGGLWYAIPPTLQQSGGQIVGGPSYSIGVAYKASIGLYLTNSTGFTLYFRSTDTPNSGTTTCNTSFCEKNWPVFYTAPLTLAPGLSSTNFGTITPYNNTKIVTYDGYALFYWIGDTAPGETLGQGIGNFYVATVPAPVAPSATTTTTSSTTTTSTSSNAYVY